MSVSKPFPFRSNAVVTAIGSYVPERVLTNGDLEKLVDTSDEWIVQRTGIKERRIAADNQFASDLSIAAVDDMIRRYGVTVEDVDYIIVATSTPDTVFPSVASRVQAHYGMKDCGAADMQAACAGFTAAIQLASGLLLSGAHRKVLVIGAETLSKITDYTDRTTCILFGDGAGAVLMETAADGQGDLLAAYARTDGDRGHLLYRCALSPAIGEHGILTNGYIVQNGREVYRWAISEVAEGINALLDRGGLSPSEVDWFIPHSANMRIIEALCERTGIALDRALSSIKHFGNTSAASIPLAIDEAVKAGSVRPGQLMLLYGFGGGLTQAGVILRWSL
ncbi:ketoacyl-ACP synthase III [Paenibacillus arenilitoris]|uniref:Beta-ketoacyl-[acyl-carrier-protein] synthase III n=1 Tax=Paenibacillus arenilitoris TaxID=2772299 RepID=A0A927H7Y6_9BACL|nr:ketoacyl-ACP synthase III [Paenibacillus arenilitoris]MBD2871520.1 ketoacyl-ACP synthase III [Paenibacillus arenilitoris]